MDGWDLDDIPECTNPSPNKKSSGSGSAQWNEQNTNLLGAVCVAVAMKGYLINGSFNRDGWRHVVERFNRNSNNNYTLKQIRHKFLQLKKEYSLYKTHIQNQTGLGWTDDGRRIRMNDDWWKETIKAKPQLKVFRGKDLHVFTEYGSELFDGNIATGANRKRASQYSRHDKEQSVDWGTGEDMEDSDPDRDGRDERSDSSDGGHIPMMLSTPSTSTQQGFSIGSSGSSGSKRKRDGVQYKGKGKMTSGMAFKTGIEEWIQFKKTGAQAKTPTSMAPSIEECVEALDRARDIDWFDDLTWCFLHQAFVDKEGSRKVFMSLKSDHDRAKWARAYYATNNHQRG